MKSITQLFFLLLISILFSCSDELDDSEVRVEGTVAYITGGSGSTINAQPVPGADVSFYPAGSVLRDKIGSATTDSQGKFSFDIAPGNYDIVAFKSGSTGSTPPPGSSSKSNVNIPESQKGKTFSVGEFLY